MPDDPAGAAPVARPDDYPSRLSLAGCRRQDAATLARWLAYAEATGEEKRAETIRAALDMPKTTPPEHYADTHAAAAAAALPIGPDREARVVLYEQWQDARVRAGHETCDHLVPSAKTCTQCFDACVWERLAAEAPQGMAVADHDGDDHDDAERTLGGGWSRRERDEEEDDDDGDGGEPDEEYTCRDCHQPLVCGECVRCPPRFDDAEPALVADRLRLADGRELTAEDVERRIVALEDCAHTDEEHPVTRREVVAIEARIAKLEAAEEDRRDGDQAARTGCLALPRPAPTVPVFVRETPATFALRCSSLPRFRACAASCDLSPDQIRIESESEPARLGTAVHALGRLVVEGRDPWSWIDAHAERYDVDAGDLRYLLHQLVEAWRVLAPLFPGAVAEEAIDIDLPGLRLTGHPDVWSLSGGVLRIADWKSGRKMYDAREQLRGYALTLVERLIREGRAVDRIELYPVWLREGRIAEPLTMTVAQLREWGADLARRATARPLPYSPGDHCAECPRRADCPAKAAWLRQAVAEFGEPDVGLGHVMRRAKAIASMAEDAIAAIRDRVREHGEIPVEPGIVLMAVVEDRSRVRLDKAGVLGDALKPLMAEATASWGAVRKAMKGKSHEEIEALRGTLREAGALEEAKVVKVQEGIA